jgi:ribonuclease III
MALSQEHSVGLGLARLEGRLGLEFRDPELLRRALTHSSAAVIRGRKICPEFESNERLEFLGDAVLGLVLSKALMRRAEALPEGVMSRLRAALVNEGSLAKKARSLGLGSHLVLSKGEIRGGGRDKDSVLADAMEAVIAAIFNDRGFRCAEAFVLQLFADELSGDLDLKVFKDYKTTLQELTQGALKDAPQYRVRDRTGPDHEVTYEVEVLLRDQVLGVGRGVSKKRASQEAARSALAAIEQDGMIVPGFRQACEAET